MANAPVFGSGYMEVAATPANPPNQNETLAYLDPVFMTAWNQNKYRFPKAWQGDPAFIKSVANVAYDYKDGTGTTTASITNISPTTGVHNVAFTMTVTGLHFDAGCILRVGGVPVSLASATSTTLTANVAGSLVPIAGTYAVTVQNTDGSTSNSTNYTAT